MFSFETCLLFSKSVVIFRINSVSSIISSEPNDLIHPARMSSIEDLPPEMICKLFKLLNAKDLVICSMVNKFWRSIYSNFKLDGLFVTTGNLNREFADNLGKWSYLDQPIEDQELCEFKVFRHLIDRPLLSNLKRLYLAGKWSDLKGDKLNGLLTGSNQLLQLELRISFSYHRGELHLKLPKLKVLAFHWINQYCSLSVDCPELNVLLYQEYAGANLLTVKHPETIRKLETNMFGTKLARFNVEYLINRDFTDLNLPTINRSTLVSLPKLKKLDHNERLSCLPQNMRSSPDLLKSRLREFLNDAKELKGKDFQFRFAGFQVTKAMLDQIDFKPRQFYHDECVYLKNYGHIDPDAVLNFLRRVDYIHLMNSVIGELPTCFFKKFPAIREVQIADKIEDPNHFLYFLKSLRLLRRLNLYNSQLDQKYYDQLPTSARSLSTFFWKGEKKQQLLNFGFIAQFPFLVHLSIKGNLCIESVASLVGSLGKLNGCDFHFDFHGNSNFVGKTEDSSEESSSEY